MRQKKKNSLDSVKATMNSYGKKQRRLSQRSVFESMGGNQQRAKQNCKTHGFTLIEVLIAISLLSVLLGVTFVASNVFMVGRQKGVNIVKEKWGEFRNYSLIKSLLESAYDYHVKSNVNLSSFSATTIRPFFHGQENQIDFITLSSIYESHKAAIVSLLFERNSAEKKGRLIYREASLKNRLVEFDNEKIEYGKELILVPEVEQATFRYYGQQGQKWDSEALEFDAIYGWSSTYFGSEKGFIPEKVELVITYLNDGTKEKLLFRLADNNMKKKIIFIGQAGGRPE